MPTPHNSAKKGDFAKTVLMPGDPLRSKFIADNYLENAVLVNNPIKNFTGAAGERPHGLSGVSVCRPAVAQ